MCQNLMDSIRVVMYSHFISLISNAINTEKYSIEKILILILKKNFKVKKLIQEYCIYGQITCVSFATISRL